MTFSEEQIEKAVREAMNKVDERGLSAPPTSTRGLTLETPYGSYEMGAIFKAQTVKSSYNYILFLMVYNDFVYYVHGDRAKKVAKSHFINLIESGDLEYTPRDKADPERLSLSVLGMMAMANGVPFNDYMKTVWGHGEGSDANQYAVG